MLPVRALLLFVTSLMTVHAFPDGAPVIACESMIPQHFVPPQTDEPRYTLSHVDNGDGTYTGMTS